MQFAIDTELKFSADSKKKKKKFSLKKYLAIYLLQVDILVACREMGNKIPGGSGAGKQKVQYPQMSQLLLNAFLADPSV